MSDSSTRDRLLDTFVYGPLGLALYARDAAPGFLRLFVARGRHEFDRHKDQVADQINDGVETAMTVGQQAMASAPEVRRRVEGTVGTARDLVGEVVTNLRDGAGSNGVDDAPARSSETPSPSTAPSRPAAAPTQAPTPQNSAPQVPTTQASTTQAPTEQAPTEQAPTRSVPPRTPTTASPGPSATNAVHTDAPGTDTSSARGAEAPPPSKPEAPSSRPAGGTLPIPDYDELAASQVVERLEGLAPDELTTVANYERSRRGRRTILGKIEQLTS